MTAVLKLAGITLPAGPGYPRLINFLNPVAALPNTTGLVGAWVFGGDQALSLENLAAPGTSAGLVGSPTFNPIGVSVNLTNCIDTGLPETPAYTFIAIIKPPASGDGVMVVSNYGSGTPLGSSLYFQSLTELRNLTPTSGGSTFASVNLGSPVTSDWYALYARTNTTSADVGFRHTGSLTSASTSTGSRATAARNLRIGGHYDSSGFESTLQVLGAFIWNVSLSDSDRTATLSALDTFFTDQLGITTL